MHLTIPAAGRGQRQLALWLLCAASLMVILDGTIVTVALPSIQLHLGFSAASLSWVMNAYLIAFGSLLLLAGRLGDLIGRKRMFCSGLAVFTAASLACGMSTGPQMLIAARFGQGIGAAMVSAVSLGMIVALVPEPAQQARIFSVRSVSGANLAQLLVIAAAFGFQVIITLYMQRVLGYGAAASGLGLLPTAVAIGTVSLGLSARIAARFGQRAMLLAGLVLIAAALALLTRLPVHASYPAHLLPALLIFGIGGGLTLPALASLGMSGATDSDAGLASGLFNTTQQVGAALGVAVLSTLAAAQARSLHATSISSAAALAAGYHLAFAIGTVLTVAAIIVAAAVLRRRTGSAPRPAPAAGTRHDTSRRVPD